MASYSSIGLHGLDLALYTKIQACIYIYIEAVLCVQASESLYIYIYIHI